MNWLKVLIVAFLGLSNGHMWLRTPLSRGGLTFIGGTGGPCSGRAAGTGSRSTYEVGQTVTFQFRVNQHGPAPFKIALSTANDNFVTILKDNIPNTVTAGADGFDGVNVQITIPDVICSSCSVQLSGMGELDGKGKWYNCADIEIVAQGQGGLPLPSSISPAQGPTSGGANITVTGSRFGTSQASQKCKFGQTVVAAIWESEERLRCISPIYNIPAEVSLEVSRDGQKFSSSGLVFTYTGAAVLPVVTRITPSSGGIGTPLIIDGENFFSNAMLCRFGTVTVDAYVVSPTRASCTVPPLEDSVVVAPLEVNVDGSPYSSSGLTFTVSTRTSSAHSLLPSFLLLLLLPLLLSLSWVGF